MSSWVTASTVALVRFDWTEAKDLTEMIIKKADESIETKWNTPEWTTTTINLMVEDISDDANNEILMSKVENEFKIRDKAITNLRKEVSESELSIKDTNKQLVKSKMEVVNHVDEMARIKANYSDKLTAAKLPHIDFYQVR